VVDRLAGLLIDTLGPEDVLDIGLGHHGLPVVALHGVEEAVAPRMGDQLAALAANRAVDQDMGAGLVVVPEVARRVLEEPVHLAVVRIPGDQAVGVEIVAWPIGRVEHRDWIAGAPEHLIAGDVVAAGDPHGAPTGLPGIVLVLPGLAAGLAWRRDHVLLPGKLPGLGVEPGDPVPHAAVAAGGANDDLVLHGERSGSELQIGLAVGNVGFP